MVQVIWTRRALADVRSIRAYIGSYNPFAAQRIAARLVSCGESLNAAPNRGRIISHGRRELTVVPPYLIRYRVTAEAVVVLEIRHGARAPDA